ncbi:translation initiation factor eIF-2B subunit delta [Frankliniella occidentalis]|uniref:Translation initiation factor eIF2B subunit delta n=1 Tax=Frankliniella occidentalis TaxID=133901 RepID=A0A6J1S4B4_FRAOC|nr:translation initiation factor eIF-2B subunit delta [Frankliniella occidentalis]
MDHHQAFPNSKHPRKKKKQNLSKSDKPSFSNDTATSEDLEAELKSSKQCQENLSSAQSVSTTEFQPEEPGAGPAKRKRNRKKQTKTQSVDKEISAPEKLNDESNSIVQISASFIPVVQKAIHLLEASEQQMNCSQSTGTSNSTKSSKKAKKGKTPSAPPHSEVVTVVSPGASRLSGTQGTSNTSVNVTDHYMQQSGKNFSGLNLQDIEFLKSASSIGPIYSRSSFSSSVTVTSSSLSNQLSSERICSAHLYGGIPNSSGSEISSIVSTMSAPEASKKSREDVEAERKARKAAKAAAKLKPKSNAPQEPAPTKPDKTGVKEAGTSKKDTAASSSKSVNPKSTGQNDSVETSNETIKLSEPSSSQTRKSRAPDEPDFARVNVLPSDCDENELPKSLQHLSLKDDPEKKERLVIKKSVTEKPIETTKKEVSDKKGENEKKGDIEKKEGSEKSKAELKAERRAKQEAQRAAKAQQQEKQKALQNVQKQTIQQPKSLRPPEKPQLKDIKAKEQGKISSTSKSAIDTKAERRVKLFSHLYQNSFKNISQTIGVSHPQYHMSIVRLGVQYSNRVILGSNARCLALLYTLKDLIADYETPPQKEFSRGLEAYLQPNMDFLQQCRPHSVSMVNALRYIKWQLTQLSIENSDTEARQHILEAIDQYISDQIGKAAEAIGEVVKDKIDDNDVILVYACSSLVLSALKIALETKRKFHVIVVDSLPWLEGREMLRRLVSMGVQCSYVHLSAASFVMRQVSKVLLGAHALLANGYVMSRAGTSQIALLAHAYNVPVLVCCETYKFSERVQTDSIVYNELADPDELIGSRRAGDREKEGERPLANWRDIPSLSLLNLVYDVTPPDLVTAVVTERAILPCTSVPVILRIKPTEC